MRGSVKPSHAAVLSKLSSVLLTHLSSLVLNLCVNVPDTACRLRLTCVLMSQTLPVDSTN